LLILCNPQTLINYLCISLLLYPRHVNQLVTHYSPFSIREKTIALCLMEVMRSLGKRFNIVQQIGCQMTIYQTEFMLCVLKKICKFDLVHHNGGKEFKRISLLDKSKM